MRSVVMAAGLALVACSTAQRRASHSWALHPPPANEAEELYFGMVDRLVASRTLRFDVTRTWFDLRERSLTGTCVAEAPRSLALDGAMFWGQHVWVDGGAGWSGELPDDRAMYDELCALLCRGGSLSSIVPVAHSSHAWYARGLDALRASQPKVSLGARERISGREAQALDVELTVWSSWRFTLWIDLETRLPVRRRFGNDRWGGTETYSNFVVDGPINAGAFVRRPFVERPPLKDGVVVAVWAEADSASALAEDLKAAGIELDWGDERRELLVPASRRRDAEPIVDQHVRARRGGLWHPADYGRMRARRDLASEIGREIPGLAAQRRITEAADLLRLAWHLDVAAAQRILQELEADAWVRSDNLDVLIAALPGRPSFWMQRASQRERDGRLEEAIGDLTRALELAPDARDTWRDRGRLRSWVGDPAAAVRDFTKAMSLADHWPEVLFERAQAHEAMGDAKAALADAKSALAMANTASLEAEVRAYVARLERK